MVFDPDDPSGERKMRQQSEYTCTPSGGMTADAMIAYGEKIFAPAWAGAGLLPSQRKMVCVDGFAEHHRYRVVKYFDEVLNADLAARFPHGSRKNQKEDFANFSRFSPAHEAAKVDMQATRVKALRKTCKDRVPTRAESIAAATPLADALRAAKRPWELAFATEVNIQGWAEEGVIPFTCKLGWDLLAQEKAKGVVAPRVPDSTAAWDHYGLPPPLGLSRC